MKMDRDILLQISVIWLVKNVLLKVISNKKLDFTKCSGCFSVFQSKD